MCLVPPGLGICTIAYRIKNGFDVSDQTVGLYQQMDKALLT